MYNSEKKHQQKFSIILLLIASIISFTTTTLIAFNIIPYQVTIGFIPMYFYMGILTHKVFKF
jgi:predicted membrane protein